MFDWGMLLVHSLNVLLWGAIAYGIWRLGRWLYARAGGTRRSMRASKK